MTLDASVKGGLRVPGAFHGCLSPALPRSDPVRLKAAKMALEIMGGMRAKRVVLLAMSGVRVKDAELLRLGMTLPGFVERGRVIAQLPSLGLLTIAAEAGGNRDYIYVEAGDDLGATIESVLDLKPDVVAISSLTARILDAYAIADALRSCGVTVFLGGLHASVMPDEAGEHADSVSVGEGEGTFHRMLEDFERGCLQPRYVGSTHDVRFTTSRAVPRFDLLEKSRYNRLTIQTSRGCPLDCVFCGASRLISRYKIKPIEQVRRELEVISSIWPEPFIELADDNTFVNKKWAQCLARLLAEFRVRWFTETDISIADDDALLETLAASGCVQLLVGLESANRSALRSVDRKGWKHRRWDDYFAAIAKVQGYGISVNGCFILGFDEDGPEVFEATRDFVTQSGLTEVQVTILTPFPATALYRRLLSEDRLLKPVFWDECTLFDVTFRPAQMSPEELRNGFVWLLQQIYSPQASADRKTKLRRLMRSAVASRVKEAGE